MTDLLPDDWGNRASPIDKGHKWCPRCKMFKRRNVDFYFIKTIMRPQGICKICSLIESREYKKNKKNSRANMEAEAIPDPSVEWREIPWRKDIFVSSDGRVYRRFHSHCRPAGEMKRHQQRQGYIQVRIDRKLHFVHRLVAECFLGSPPGPDYEVAHWDGIKDNNTVGNLRWATHAENCSDTIRHGRTPRGEKSAFNKLRLVDVIDIKSGKYESAAAAAKALGVKPVTIRNILNGNEWKWLDEDAINSYLVAIGHFRERHLAGEPLPPLYVPRTEREEPAP